MNFNLSNYQTSIRAFYECWISLPSWPCNKEKYQNEPQDACLSLGSALGMFGIKSESNEFVPLGSQV
jgi:hypothetical protein